MRSAFWLLALVLFSGCSSQLRQPFCSNPLPELPQEFTGIYEVVMPALSPAWSNNMILKTLLVSIDKDTVTSSAPLMGLPGWGQICEVGGRYFVEKQNSNGTYSLSEISRFKGGLVVSELSIDLDSARSKGYKLHYLPPKVVIQEKDSQSLDLFFPMGTFILDNSGFQQSDVLKVSKSVSFQMVFRLLPVTRGFKPKSVVKLRTLAEAGRDGPSR